MAFIRTIIITVLLSTNTWALQLETPLESPALEHRAQMLFKQIRCAVCSGESIQDSDAPLAQDMRALIRREIKTGKDDSSILTQLANSYGQEILLETSLKHQIVLLAVPILFLLSIIYFTRKNF